MTQLLRMNLKTSTFGFSFAAVHHWIDYKTTEYNLKT